MTEIAEFKAHVSTFMQSRLTWAELVANFALGLAGETGETVDLIKKFLYHGEGIDQERLKLELGDVFWYLFALCELLDVSPEACMSANIAKLQSRHGGNTFNREAAIKSKGDVGAADDLISALDGALCNPPDEAA